MLMTNLYKQFYVSLASVVVGALMAGLCLGGLSTVHAQDFEVEGTVLAQGDETPLPGVNVIEVGTQTGTTTDANGEFQLAVSGPDAELEFSFVGFQAKTVPVEGQSELTVRLIQATEELNEVVVTALGVERQRRGLGYSVESVEAEDVVQGTEGSVTELLQSRIAGVDINSVGGGAGSASRITIRGASGLGSNRPLFVIDGIPIDNQYFGGSSQWGGTENGSALNDLNPEDIESVNVLKGGAAAALYGSRARNGVIEIETKSGRGGDLRVQYTNNTTFQQTLDYFDDYQTSYGHGTQGSIPTTQDEAQAANFSSWGALLEEVNQDVIQPDGQERPYANRNDRLGFYQGSLNTKNSLSVSGGTEDISNYFSATYLTEGNRMPNNEGMRRVSVNLRSELTLDRFSADVKANYVNQKVQDRMRLHDFPGNPNWPVSFFPQTFDLNDMKPGFDRETRVETRTWIPSQWVQNPWFAVNRFDQDDTRNRFIGHIDLDFELASGVTLGARSGLDWGLLNSESVTPYGTGWKPGGSVGVHDNRTIESTTDVTLEVTQSLPFNLTVDGYLGASLRYRHAKTVGGSGSNFRIPGFAVLNNMSSQSGSYGISEKQVRSGYGSLDLSYNDYLYLQVTGRNDWSSTLPQDNNSFFYPSVSAGFVFSDAFSSAMPSWLDFGKVRAAWSEVGSDTSPYQLNITYSFADFAQLGRQMGSVASGEIPLSDLKPTTTTEIELGAEFRFIDERLTFDFTWYDRQTTDQILSADVPQSTGYGSRVINAGELSNTGIEALVTVVPLQTDDMRWSWRVNFDRNVNTVDALRPGLPQVQLGQSRVLTGRSVARVGEAMGSIFGTSYVRDEDGNIVHDEEGMPLVGEEKVLGKGTPDWSSGIGTTFSYGNFSATAQFDVRWGGQVFSATNAWATSTGLHEQTLEGRAQCDEATSSPGDRYPADGCWTPDGVYEDGSPVDQQVRPQDYWSHVYGEIAEEFVYDRNIVKLRELRLGYQLPSSLLSAIGGVRSARISVTGRNLFYLYDPVPNVDPLVERNASNDQGLEGALTPTTRNYGFSVDLTF
jgi:TonB-linked SusC/RagA family outer membrane protein